MKKVQVNVNLEPELKKDLQELAKLEGRSLSNLLLSMIRNDYKLRYRGLWDEDNTCHTEHVFVGSGIHCINCGEPYPSKQDVS